MNKIKYYYFFIVLLFFLIDTSCANGLTVKGVKDSIKIVYVAIPFPTNVNLTLMYYRRLYIDHRPYIGEDYKTIKLDIIPHMKQNNTSKRRGNTNQPEKAQILYSFKGRDTLAFDAVFSGVKFDGEYYIVAFPHESEWEYFTPPQKEDGSFLYTPIAFHLDTVKWVLTKMRYNDKLLISYIKSIKSEVYDNYKYSHQFDRYFSFSKKKGEFVFGKVKKISQEISNMPQQQIYPALVHLYRQISNKCQCVVPAYISNLG